MANRRNNKQHPLGVVIPIEDEDVEEELRKLEEDFQKSLQRATKVFDSRMGNLQRSQVEKEEQHKKTLEKHEKDRAEFERRIAEEEKLKMKRIEEIHREWEKKRETVSRQKRKLKNCTKVAEQYQQHPSGSSLHIRSTSTASSAKSISPATTSHKRPQDASKGPATDS